MLGNGSWSVADIEAVADQPRLPALVVRAQRLDARLNLQLDSGAHDATTAVLTERVLARVSVGESGLQTYRVSYLLAHVGARQLDIELPAPVPSLNLRVLLDKNDVAAETVDESGQQRPTGGALRGCGWAHGCEILRFWTCPINCKRYGPAADCGKLHCNPLCCAAMRAVRSRAGR